MAPDLVFAHISGFWRPEMGPAASATRIRSRPGKRPRLEPARLGVQECCTGETSALQATPPLLPAEMQRFRTTSSGRPCPEHRDAEHGEAPDCAAPGRPHTLCSKGARARACASGLSSPRHTVVRVGVEPAAAAHTSLMLHPLSLSKHATMNLIRSSSTRVSFHAMRTHPPVAHALKCYPCARSNLLPM